jgi:hypothetical protein
MSYDKSFREALEERTEQIAQDIKAEMVRCAPKTIEQTVEQATNDVDLMLRDAVVDILKLTRVETLLRFLEEGAGILSREQCKELRNYVTELHDGYIAKQS